MPPRTSSRGRFFNKLLDGNDITGWILEGLSGLQAQVDSARARRFQRGLAYFVEHGTRTRPADTASHIEAFLIAAARLLVPGYGAPNLDTMKEKLVAQYEPPIAKHITRKQKKLLEELVPHLMVPPPNFESFLGALVRAELRVSYILTGDLLATIDDVRGADAGMFALMCR